MTKINSLTDDQVAYMQVSVQKWLDIGFDCKPINYHAAKDAINMAYDCAKQSRPKHFVFTDGPTDAIKLLAIAHKITLTKDDFDRLSASDDPTLLSETLLGILRAEEKKGAINLSNKQMPSFYGQHEAGWLSFQDYFADQFGLSEMSKGLREAAKECGWVWFYGDIVIISAKPLYVKRDAQNRLHNEKGPSIEYADGTKCYSYNGNAIPEKWVLERETMDPSEILSHQDADKRAAGAALFGYARMKDKLDYKIIDGDPNTDIGALISLKLPGLDDRGHFLEAICPRNGPVFLGVPLTSPWDNNARIDTAFKAQAFLARFPASKYMHPELRT